MNGPLEGKTALVTGGSRGVGKGIAQRLVRDGALVVIGYREDDRTALDAVAECDAEHGDGRMHAVRADLTRVAEVAHLFDRAEALVGGLDILVNNAAVMRRGTLADSSEELFDDVLAVNLKGTFFALQQAVHRLREGGRVINVSSTATALAHPSQAAYSASKAAVEQLTRVAAKEFSRRGITVNSVAPGAVETERVSATVAPEVLRQWGRSNAFGRLARPQDIADVVGFLAGPDSRWVTGQNLRASGGAL
ncbi:SDR family oxidoreductase [Kitasatospora viridis]|uniref:3-oxoacyl-[acyl-carrier protein] reductase n=1 Tax=Kitasatospora viridis TaxID=281105 RepID=A0A561SFZ5_9ACTN|nr:SDR family oxidoreductase [Kitasatospora viridis]TWF73801.1 3-oxoacyl-[acyl-carrier protein] reductase [Kitasatospora viridis]